MIMVYVIPLVFVIAFMLTLLKSLLNAAVSGFKANKHGIPPEEEKANTDDLNSLYRELEYLTGKLSNLEELQRLTEQSYQAAVNVNKQAVYLRKMITLDNQIHDTQKRINAIKEELPP